MSEVMFFVVRKTFSVTLLGKVQRARISKALNFSFLMALVSCVGTIKSVKVPTGETSSLPEDTIEYDGLVEVEAIAEDKIEVRFTAANLDAEQAIYEVYIDGFSTPYTFPGIDLVPDYRGLLNATVYGLEVGTRYNVTLQVFDREKQIRSANASVFEVQTIANVTADFWGVATAEPLPGVDGINAIEVKWPAATKRGNVISSNPRDPAKYVVNVVNLEFLTPGDLWDSSFGPPARYEVEVTGDAISKVVSGLPSDSEFAVNVRAVHEEYLSNTQNPNYFYERNYRYVVVKTLSDDLSEIDFDSESFQVLNSDGSEGLSAVDLSWTPATGPFASYRIYYTKDASANLFATNMDENCNGQESNNLTIYCTEVAFDASTVQIAGLSSYTDYRFVLAVCASYQCESSRRIMGTIVGKFVGTEIATFNGLQNITGATDLEKADEIYLNFGSPNFATGALDGLIVEYKGDDGNTPTFLNHPSEGNGSTLTVKIFNYIQDTTIAVKGVDVLANQQYCFEVIPFLYDSEGEVQISRVNGSTKCFIPSLDAPDDESFDGELSYCVPGANFLQIAWEAPNAGGIYSEYRIFYKRTSDGPFSFADATGGNSDYGMITVSKNTTQATIYPLESGTAYHVGVLTYFNGNGSPIYSSFHSNAEICTTD